MSLSTLIKSIQDIMRKDHGVDGDAQRISQLVWMLFLKIIDDKEEEYEVMKDKYKSAIPEKLRWRNWAKDSEGITGDELLAFINNELFVGLKELEIVDINSLGYIVKEVFNDSYNYMKSGTLIREILNKLESEIDFTKSNDRHLFNDIYEQILKDLQSAGNAGEFYTPRAVTEFIVEMVNPKLGEKVMDPACGTGGFLTCTIEHLRKEVKTVEDEKIIEDTIFGTELKQLPHLLATTNMILHGVEIPKNLKHDNSLSYRVTDFSDNEKMDCFIMNPPFGGTVQDGVLTNFPKKFQNKNTAYLFLIYVFYRLKNHGRVGIVLPDGGIMSGENTSEIEIKKKWLEEFNLHTIVRLPNGVFSPYASIKTNLLFFTKGEPTKEIWYYEHDLPTGYKTYNKSKPIRIEEFEVEKAWWNNRVESENAWKVNIEDIVKNNYNLDIKNPNKVEEDEVLSKEELIEKISKNLEKSKEILELIKKS
ncbi:MAG: class I SAM-dependent DNA methyltransferase [Candidatus Gracilibacteria bacterium]